MDNTLIVALTAKTMRSDRETALVTGCDGFLAKPIDPFLFAGQVKAYLGGRRDQLEQGREGPALRQFSQQVVEHLEKRLKEAQEGNRKLLDVQAELEQRSHHLTRLLALSKDVIPIRDEGEVLLRVLEQLGRELRLDRLRVFRVHESGTYFQGVALTAEGFGETAVLAGSHPLIAWLERVPRGTVLVGDELRQSVSWQQGIELGLWSPMAQAMLVPLHSRSEGQRLWGFLAADRPDAPFQSFETELAALHAGILQVSLENAGLIAHLAKTSQALSTSYEGLESAYEALKEAQKALGAQDQKTALGGLFLNMAKKLQGPVGVLKEESSMLSSFMDLPDRAAADKRLECRRSMDQIHRAVHQVDSLVRALLRRAGQREASTPEWINLHDLLSQELDLLQAEGVLPESVTVDLNAEAPRDLLYGVYSDFAEVFGYLIGHAMEGRPKRISLRTRGEGDHFQLEVEDDGPPVDVGLLEEALEPYPELRPVRPGAGRKPGRGIPACAQLLTAYRGTVQMVPAEQGSLVRIGLPL
jgi:signal transduction histidine kinase/CheY-like chemotaxis protein